MLQTLSNDELKLMRVSGPAGAATKLGVPSTTLGSRNPIIEA